MPDYYRLQLLSAHTENSIALRAQEKMNKYTIEITVTPVPQPKTEVAGEITLAP